MKRILGIALLLALAAGSANAQTSGTNTVLRNGYCFNATTGQLVNCTTGAVLTNEASPGYSYTTSPRTLIGPVATLAPGNSATSTAAVSLGEYTSLLVMVSWNTQAAADSDSVAFGVNFVGKISTDMNDGYDFSLSNPGDSAFIARADTTVATLGLSSTGNTGGVIVPCPTVLIIARGKATITGAAGAATPTLVPLGNPTVYDLYPKTTTNMAATRSRPYHVPMGRVVWSDGHNGVCFMLTVPAGQAFKFSHLAASVQNLNRIQTYNNVKVDVWPKVN